MTTFHPPENDGRVDDLKQRYLEASAAQSIGPSEHVRRAALAHAQMVAATAAPALATQAAQAKPGNAAAANRWNFSLVASVAIACIGALLALQFDRSDSQDKDVVLGTPSVTAPPVTMQSPAAQSQDLPQKTPASAPTTASATSPSGPPARSARPAQSAPSAKESALSANSPTAKMQSTQPKAAPESKGPTAQALALPAPVTAAPAAPLKKNETDSTADRASADRSMQSAPPGAQSKASSSADSEFTAQPGAPAASMKSRTAPAAEPAAPSMPLMMGTGDALRSAARSGQIGLLELALQQGGAAQINAPDKSGRTALMLATLGGHIGAVQRLLTAGADPSLKDAQGNNAVQMAQQLGHTVIENLLKKQPVAQ